MAEVETGVKRKVVDLIQVLRTEGIEIAAAYLYGSQATGMAHPDSDIDVAIVSPSLSGERVADWYRLNKLARRIDVRLEVLGFRPDQFRDEHPLAWEIKTTGVQIA